MIVFDNVLGRLKECGYSTYRLSKENIIKAGTLQRIRKGKPITTETVDTICRLCGCQPGDILKYKDGDAE